VLDFCGNLVMHYSLLVFADNVNPKLEYVLFPQFSWLGLFVFLTQAHAVHERAVTALDILDEYTSLSVGVNLGVLARKYF
jgi:hypothetical protein